MESKDIGLICLNCQKPILQYHKKPPKSKFHRGCREPYLKKQMHECACGQCGQLIPAFTHDLKPQKFVRGHYVKLNPRRAEDSNFWKDGRRKDSSGYILIYKPEHPFATKAGYVCEHRLVMEAHLGRYLTEDEHIHHINGDKKDNRLQNLQIMSNSEHIRWHRLHETRPHNYKPRSPNRIRKDKILEYASKHGIALL